MINAESFLYIDKKFISIKEFNGVLPDWDYIDGAIRLEINGQEIISLEMWDLIDQLWSYLINGIIEIEEGKKEFSATFPDQPLPFSYKVNGPFIKITVDENKTAVNYKEFVSAIVYYSKEFFKELLRIEPSLCNKNQYYLEHLDLLEKKYGKYIPLNFQPP